MSDEVTPEEQPKECIDEKFIDVSGFLYINSKGGIRATKKRCATKEDEIRTSVSVRIPRAYFDGEIINVEVEIPKTIKQTIKANAATEGSW